jgi:alpha-1,2-mannosyltransferase
MASDQAFNSRSRKFLALLMPAPWRAWAAWLIFASVIGAMVAAAPDYRTVTPNYRDACRDWFEGRPIYAPGVHGFLYFPHAAILFAPFTYAPVPIGEALWRIVSIGSLAWAVWRLAILTIQNPASTAKSSPEMAGRLTFVLMTCAAIPPATASARNGQMNLLLAGLTALAFVELARGCWRAGAVWLCLGAAFKPLMIVPMTVAAVVYRPVRRPLAVGAVALFLAPFLTQHPGYVWQQYQICAHKLVLAGNPGWENPGSDLFGLLSWLGYAAPLAVQTATRVVAGGLTVVLALVAVRRRQPVYAAGLVLALTACYLALFNPRMENNGFVVLSPTLGLLAADAFLNRRRIAGVMILVVSLGVAGSYEITRGHNFWLCPLLTLFVWVGVIGRTLGRGRNVPAGELLLGSTAPDIAGDRRHRGDQRQGRHRGQVDLNRQRVAS